jgi:hypothetical protein
MNRQENRGAVYGHLKETYATTSARHKKILFIISLARLIIFIAGVTVTFVGFSSSLLPGLISFTGFSAIFLYLLKIYKVTFDQLLRDGITTRMNASILMKEMGITD